VNVEGDDVIVVEARMGAPPYSDQGAVCRLQGEDISQLVRVGGTMFPRTNSPGTFSVTYHCAGNFGNEASPATRTVVVRDTTCPVCTVALNETEIEASFPYVGAGATCSDAVDGPIADVVTISEVDVTVTGRYFVTYRAKDSAGNWNDGSCNGSEVYRTTVNVVDTLKPVISLRRVGGGEVPSRRLLFVEKAAESQQFSSVALVTVALVVAMISVFRKTRSSDEIVDV